GKENVIRISIAVLAVSLVLSAVAMTYPMLVSARVLSGMAAGGIIPAAIAVVGDRVPFAERQVTLARLMTANYIGMLSGPAVAGMIGSTLDWQMVFLLSALIVGMAGAF